MIRKRIAVFALMIMFLTFLVISILIEVSAQQEMEPEWIYEDESWFTGVAVSADGNYIGAGTNNTNKFYLFRDGVLLWNYSVGSVHSISMSSDGKYIAVGAGNDFYLFESDDSSSPLLEYPVDYESSIVTLSSEGKYVMVGTMPNVSQQNASSRLYVFERGQSQPSWTRTLPGVLESLSLSSNGDYLVASTSLPGVLYLFSREQEAPLWSYFFGERSGGVKISSDGETVVATGGNQSDEYGLRIFLFSQQHSTPRYMKVIPELPSSRSVSVSSNGSVFAINTHGFGIGWPGGNRLVLFDWNVRPYGPRSIRDASLPASGVSMSMSSDGKYVFVGTLNGIFVYEYLNNELKLKNQYTTNSSIIFDVACSSDGEYVVALGKSSLSGDERYQIYFFVMGNVVNPWAWSDLVVVGVIVVVIIGAVGFIFYRSSRRVDVRAF